MHACHVQPAPCVHTASWHVGTPTKIIAGFPDNRKTTNKREMIYWHRSCSCFFLRPDRLSGEEHVNDKQTLISKAEKTPDTVPPCCLSEALPQERPLFWCYRSCRQHYNSLNVEPRHIGRDLFLSAVRPGTSNSSQNSVWWSSIRGFEAPPGVTYRHGFVPRLASLVYRA